jgi:hypothetical protein
MVTEYMGIRNESFMKIAAVGTWMGDFVTAWMVRWYYPVVAQHGLESTRISAQRQWD